MPCYPVSVKAHACIIQLHEGWAIRCVRKATNIPRGSKYPISKDSDPKNHTLNGFWEQSPGILGTWALWHIFPCKELKHPGA